MKIGQLRRSAATLVTTVLASFALACAPLAAYADAADAAGQDTSLRGALEQVLTEAADAGAQAADPQTAAAQDAAADDAAQDADAQGQDAVEDGTSDAAGSSPATAPAAAGQTQGSASPASSATARGGSTYVDTAGNLFVGTDEDQGTAYVTDALVDEKRDLVFFGNNGIIEDAQVGGDVIAAARNVTLSASQVAGSVRAAGETVEVIGTQVAGNVTLAGENVEFDAASQAGAVYLAAQHASMLGAADCAEMFAQTVSFNATVGGDVAIYASEVVIGKDADIAGQLTVYAPSRPEIPTTAKIGSVRYVQAEGFSVNDRIDQIFAGTFVESIQDAVPPFLRSYVGLALVTVVVCLVCAVLLALFLRGMVERSGVIAHDRFAFLLVSGLLGVFLVVPVIALLALMLATVQLAVALSLLLGIVLAICIPFTAASLGKAVLPRVHRVVSALLFSIIIGILLVVPYANIAVAVFCVIYMLGYLVQSMYLGMRGRDVSIGGRSIGVRVAEPAAPAEVPLTARLDVLD